MDKSGTIVCLLLAVLQVARTQPNLAALLGLGAFGNIAESMPSVSSSCPYQAHANKLKFSQMVNNRLMTQECAPGTMFVLSKCSCDNIPSGGSGAAPMPGSNPRLGAFGGGGNPLLSALMNQLQTPHLQPRRSRPTTNTNQLNMMRQKVPTGVPPETGNPLFSAMMNQLHGGSFPTAPVRAPPPTRSRTSTNQLNMIRQKVTSGIRPDQKAGGVSVDMRKAGHQAADGIPYNLSPNTGLTSVVDPSILHDVLPPEILRILQGANAFPALRKPIQTTRPKPPSVPPRLPKMTNRASKPASSATSPPPTKSYPHSAGGHAFPPGGLPHEVLEMLQRSRRPPPSSAHRQQNPRRLRQKLTKIPSVTTKPRRKPKITSRRRQIPTRSPTRVPTPAPTRAPRPRTPKPRADPLAGIMKQVLSSRRQSKAPQRNKRPQVKPQSGPRNDPLAALLDGLNQRRGSSRGPSRGSTHSASRSPSRSPTRGASRSPSHSPTRGASRSPSRSPTRGASRSPSRSPTRSPSRSPSRSPTRSPSRSQTRRTHSSLSRVPPRSSRRGSGRQTGGNALQALMAGIGGGSGSPSSRGGSGDPLAALWASMGGGSGSQSSTGGSGDPLAALWAGMGSGSGSRGGNSGLAALLAGGGGGGRNASIAALLAGTRPQGGGNGALASLLTGGGRGNGALAALLAGAGGGSRSGSLTAPGGALDVMSLAGNLNVANLLGETPGPGLAQNLDMTALFNAQGRMGAGGGLAGLNNLNFVKLQQMDRQGLIDLSDLTPAGMAAANAHFAG